MSDNSNPDYILGTSDAELRRLEFQHSVWLDHAVDAWNDAGFRDGDRILDLGAGPGFASIDLARRVGRQGSVTAVDASSKYLQFLQQESGRHGLDQIEIVQADVETDFPKLGKYTGVYIRWLLCFLKYPKEVVQHVANTLEPGGVVSIQDYFNYGATQLYPAHPVQDTLFDAFYRSAAAHGGDYNIGSSLPAMLSEAGLVVTRLKPVCETARPGSPVWKWFRMFTETYLPQLVEGNFLQKDEADTVFHRLDSLELIPGAFFFSPPVILITARKPVVDQA